MRLWITGLGLVTPLGVGVDASWGRLVRGERAFAPITRFATEGYRASLGAEVKEAFAPADGAWSRTAAMAQAAAREAMGAAGIDVRASRVGLVCGGTTGGMLENESLLARVYADPSRRDELGGLLSHPLWATTDRLHETLGPFARVRALSSACSSGANALIVGAAWLLAGDVDAVVCGGADGLCRLTLAGFNALAAIDAGACRPFDARRRGLNLGEGAGFVVLERDDRARARRATPVAELAGWGLGAEAHHITNPEAGGGTAARVMARAIERAGLTSRDVDYVNAHGTGTPLNDAMEATAIATALGADDAARAFTSSTKGQIGHTLGAAGAIEAAFAVLAIARQSVPPTGGLEQVDPACAGLRHVLREGRGARVRASLSNAFGFGGMDTALLFTEPELARPRAVSLRRVVVTSAATLTSAGLRGTRDVAQTLDASDGSEGDATAVLPSIDAMLDADRARRLDRPARLGAVVAQRALADAGLAGGERVGCVLGSSFGSIDASAAFMHRIFSKGARLASPAEFPNLVPSSPVGHVSIYLGLRGPVLAAAELGTTGECAAMQAAELVAAGEVDAIVAGDVEESSRIVERVFAALFAHDAAAAGRGEGGAAIVIEAEDAARARGATVAARVVATVAWRSGDPRPAFPRPAGARAVVILPRVDAAIDALLAGTPWADAPRAVCAASAGEHPALGAIAIAAAVGRIARGDATDALVVGLAKGRGYAVALGSP